MELAISARSVFRFNGAEPLRYFQASATRFSFMVALQTVGFPSLPHVPEPGWVAGARVAGLSLTFPATNQIAQN
jgi:hypothetical protein